MLITRALEVPRNDFDCILHEMLCLKRWDTSRGLKPTRNKSKKTKNKTIKKNATQNDLPRTPARPPERGVWGAAAPGKTPVCTLNVTVNNMYIQVHICI